MTFAILYHPAIEDTPGDESFWPGFLGMKDTEEEAIALCEDHAERNEDPVNLDDIDRNAVQTILSNHDGFMRYCICKVTT